MSRDADDNAGFKTDPNAWMATLSDLVFLLITFFVLLISMSSLDSKKLKKAFGLFDDAESVLNFPEQSRGSNQIIENAVKPLAFLTSTTEKLPDEGTSTTDPKLATNKAQKTINDSLMGNIRGGSTMSTLQSLARSTGGEIQVKKTSDGISVLFPGRLLFPEGKNTLDDDGLALIRELSTILKLWGGNVDVVASWSWHDGPQVLGQVVEAMERNWIPGEKIHPELIPVSKRTINFVLKQREE